MRLGGQGGRGHGQGPAGWGSMGGRAGHEGTGSTLNQGQRWGREGSGQMRAQNQRPGSTTWGAISFFFIFYQATHCCAAYDALSFICNSTRCTKLTGHCSIVCIEQILAVNQMSRQLEASNPFHGGRDSTNSYLPPMHGMPHLQAIHRSLVELTH